MNPESDIDLFIGYNNLNKNIDCLHTSMFFIIIIIANIYPFIHILAKLIRIEGSADRAANSWSLIMIILFNESFILHQIIGFKRIKLPLMLLFRFSLSLSLSLSCNYYLLTNEWMQMNLNWKFSIYQFV